MLSSQDKERGKERQGKKGDRLTERAVEKQQQMIKKS